MQQKAIIVLFLFFVLSPCSQVIAQFELDLETGATFTGCNDVRIPGDGGTFFSLSEDLEANTTFFFRIRVFYDFNDRHHLGVLLAPLSIKSSGQLGRDLIFEGQTFPSGDPLDATYKFNSYRLVYRYDFLRKEKIRIGVGFTAKIRDAKIAIKSPTLASEKTNVGFVPIVHFRLHWQFSPAVAFLLDGDALAAPQGRAEDILAALAIHVTDQLDLKIGYRILEGGADNEEVYNFALIHYAAAGAILRF